ncbi:cytochrome c-type biogenesis protein CcmE [bacterium A37T11]|nr:cytochrome c-type biogenesis protein CcmE [bacterium A37T11]
MKRGAIIGIVVIAIAIAMIISIFTDSSTYANFTEAKAAKEELHVVGYLNKTKELHYDPVKDANLFSFYMYDKDSVECKVVFIGAKPQDIERSEQIVLTGKMMGNEFRASKILMKCPSKYNKDKVEIKAASAV